MRTSRAWSAQALAAAALLFLFASATAPATAHTPESPEVQRMVAKGADFLRTSILQGVPAANFRPGARALLDIHNTDWGAEMLAALVCYKLSGKFDDPVVTKVLARTHEAVNSGTAMNFNGSASYETAIALIFLAEIDSDKFLGSDEKEKCRNDMQKVLNYLLSQQQKCGAWMYGAQDGNGAGDTSVTQYAILALWSAKYAGLSVPDEPVVKACNWLVHTQHTSGQFFYRPSMPASSGRLPSGDQARASMTIAGVGSLYICADLLKMNLAKNKAFESDDGLPKAFRLIAPPPAAGGASSHRALQQELELGILDGEKVMAAQFPFADMQYFFYTLYSYERFQSLREHATKRKQKEPEWYNRFVDIARDSQNPDGSWVQGTGRVADTAFMCLTLLRSFQKTIAKAKSTEGTLVGGRGLPGDTSKVAVRRGKVVGGEQVNSKEDILKVLDSPDAAALDDILDQSTGSLLDSTPENRAAQIAKLRRTLIEGDYAARRAAIKVLATDDDLDNAPLLIFALSDKDMEVVRVAEQGLQRISRRLSSFEFPENGTTEGLAKEIEKRIGTWKTWYRNLRPDAIFLK